MLICACGASFLECDEDHYDDAISHITARSSPAHHWVHVPLPIPFQGLFVQDCINFRIRNDPKCVYRMAKYDAEGNLVGEDNGRSSHS